MDEHPLVTQRSIVMPYNLGIRGTALAVVCQITVFYLKHLETDW